MTRGRAFVVTSLLRQDQPTGTPCLPLLPQRLLARAAAGVDVDDRNMTQGAAVGADFRGIVGAVHQVIQVADSLRRQGRQRDGDLAVVQRRRGKQATDRDLQQLCGEDKFAVFIARKVFTAGVEFLSLYFYALNPRFKEVLNAGLATCTLFGGFDEV